MITQRDATGRGVGVEHSAGEAVAVRAEEAWRQGGCIGCGEALEPPVGRERRARGGEAEPEAVKMLSAAVRYVSGAKIAP